MTTKDILGTTVGLGALALTVRSTKMVKDSMKKPSSKGLVKGMTDLIVGTSLLVPISKSVNKL